MDAAKGGLAGRAVVRTRAALQPDRRQEFVPREEAARELLSKYSVNPQLYELGLLGPEWEARIDQYHIDHMHKMVPTGRRVGFRRRV